MRSIFVQSFVGALILVGVLTTKLHGQAKKTATVSLGNLSQTYNGSPRSATATTNAAGFRNFKFTYNGSPVIPTRAGSYSVVCILENDKFTGRATGTLVIAKASATVSLGNLRQTYTGAPRSATATSNATGSRIELTYNGSTFRPTAAGHYSVVAKETNANYQGSATGILIIAKAITTVSLGNLRQTFNGLPRSATAASNATGNSSYGLTYNGSSAPTAPGTYVVVGQLKNANYEGSATGTLVIAKATSTTALALAPANAKVGQTISLTATVTPTLQGVLPAGKVTFKDGDKAMATVTVAHTNGVATATFSFELTAKKHAFTAVYSGDSNFTASTSVESTVTKRR